MKAARTHQEIGKLIKYYRKAQNLSQKELADKAQLSQPAVSNIEKGIGGTLGAVESIMRALKLELMFRPIPKIDKNNLTAFID